MDLLNGHWASRPLSDFGQRRYHAYPHANGFADGGASVVLGQVEGGQVSLWRRSLDSEAEEQLARFEAPVDASMPTAAHLFFDVAEQANVLVVVAEGAVWSIDLGRPGKPRELYRAADGETINSLPNIAADGRRVLLQITRPDGVYAAIAIEVATGRVETIVTRDWWLSHVHFSPFDPAWIAFCHEGDTLTIPDRMWAWHARAAPDGVPIADQRWDDPARRLSLGHERACFHAASELVIAYGVSVGGPRGLYEVPFEPGRPMRLVSEGDRDWHCNVSRDGRWALVDTTGPHDAPGRGWDDAGDVSDVLLVDMQTGRRRLLARSHQTTHPWHPHPAFSPDASRVLYNESRGTRADCTGRVVLLQHQP